MADFNLDDFVRQLRAAALESEPVKKVRYLMNGAFKDPQAIKDSMPAFENDATPKSQRHEQVVQAVVERQREEVQHDIVPAIAQVVDDGR